VAFIFGGVPARSQTHKCLLLRSFPSLRSPLERSSVGERSPTVRAALRFLTRPTARCRRIDVPSDPEIRGWLLRLTVQAHGPARMQLEAIRAGWWSLSPDARRLVLAWWLASEFRAGLLPWGRSELGEG